MKTDDPRKLDSGAIEWLTRQYVDIDHAFRDILVKVAEKREEAPEKKGD